MIISCKGYELDGKRLECSFIHSGKFNDPELRRHEKVEEIAESVSKGYKWLGFSCYIPQCLIGVSSK